MDAHPVVKGRGGGVKVLHGLGVGGIVEVRYNIGEQRVLHAAERMPGNREMEVAVIARERTRTRMRQG